MKPRWRTTGGDDEGICRQLDDVVSAANALKAAIRKGLRLDGDEDAKINLQELWCPELRRMRDYGFPNVHDSISALRRLKDARKSLVLLSGSLDGAILTLTESTLPASREEGLKSLPDEILVHIFELWQSGDAVKPRAKQRNSPFTLSAVSKRFRRIVLNLPCLWKDVSLSGKFSGEHLPLHASKCPHLRPRVFVYESDPCVEEDNLNLILPHTQWEELHLTFEHNNCALYFFDIMQPRVQNSPFVSLRSLSISLDRRLQAWYFLNDSEWEAASTKIWHMPNLTRLDLKNIITANVIIKCPNVTDCSLTLDNHRSKPNIWDIDNLRSFLQSMPLLTSLSVTFKAFMSFIDDEGDADCIPTKAALLPRLASLGIHLHDDAPSYAVDQFMTLVNTSQLTALQISLNRGKKEIDPLDEEHVNEVLRVTDWISALFSLPPGLDEHGDYRRRDRDPPIRSFSSVTDFSLSVENLNRCDLPLRLSDMFRALPAVRTLALFVPDTASICLGAWMEFYGGLRDLREMRVRMGEHRHSCCSSVSSGDNKLCSSFFRSFASTDSWRKFERLVILSPWSMEGERQDLERIVGDKLVWG